MPSVWELQGKNNRVQMMIIENIGKYRPNGKKVVGLGNQFTQG